MQRNSAGPSNVWPYRRCHPNDETYKASPICIQSTWGTPGGPQLSVRWSTTKWLTDLRQNQTFKSWATLQGISAGPNNVWPYRRCHPNDETYKASPICIQSTWGTPGGPQLSVRWSTTKWLTDLRQNQTFKSWATLQGISAGPNNVWPYRRCHPNDETYKASPICIQSTWGTPGGPQLSVRWSTTKWLTDLRQNQTFKSWATLQGMSAGPNNVWPYRRCHPNDETYKASPICIQSTWGTPGGPQLSVRWSTTKWLTDLRQNQTFKSWATLQGISAGPNNVWPYRRCHPNDETYKASPICIQSTWGTPGGPQLSVRWSTTKWLTDLRQNQTFKSWATLQGISAGPNNVWPYRRCHPNDETYKASPICIQSTWGTPGGPQLSVRWSTTKWLTDLRQNQTFKSWATLQGISAGPNNVWPYRRCHPNDETYKASPICIQSTWGTPGGPQLSVRWSTTNWLTDLRQNQTFKS